MKKYLPSLNGLRCISILLVIMHHADQKNWDEALYAKFPMIVGTQLGVNIFFVMSGFLITRLLINEENKTGSISFRDFYIKRALRILPLYYILIAVYFVMQLAGILHLTWQSWITSIAEAKYFNWQLDWETGHLWSLSIEEHYYLLWPLVFTLAKPYRKQIAWCFVITIPLIRAFNIVHPIHWMGYLTIFQRVDAIMWGCLLSMYHDDVLATCQKITARWKYATWIPFLTIPALSLITILNHKFNWHLGFFIVAVGDESGTIADMAICLILIVSIHYSNTLWYRLLNTRIMTYVGTISYSLYIWQQLFFSEHIGKLSSFPLNLLLIFITANISYYLIEKPFVRLRKKVLEDRKHILEYTGPNPYILYPNEKANTQS